MIKLYRKHVYYIIAASLVIISQLYLLHPHLAFGFSDVDWGYLLYYRTFTEEFDNPVKSFIYLFKHIGVYTHQAYYIGYIYELVGINFKLMNLSVHIFRILMIISSYPIFFLLSRSRLVGIVGMILFSFSNSSVGTMYTVVTSSDYLAYLILNIFFVYYYLSIKKGQSIKLLVISFLLLVFSLFLSTERLYPIAAVIMIVEFYLFFTLKQKRMQVIRRVALYYIPMLPVFLIKPTLLSELYAANLRFLTEKLYGGEWYQILRPVASLGSLIIPPAIYNWFGNVQSDSFLNYFTYIVNYHFYIYLSFTLVSLILFKNKLKMLGLIIGSWVLASIIIYFLITHKTGYDLSNVIPLNMGSYIFIFGTSSYFEWKKTKERLLMPIFIGVAVAVIFIFFTWISADFALNFIGTHRYLTIPGMGISFAQAAIAVLFFKKIYGKGILRKSLAILPFIALGLVTYIGIKEINLFFNYHLVNGYGVYDQMLMRKQIGGVINNISHEEPSLFYFDFTDDPANGFYYDATIFGGFSSWMMFTKEIDLNNANKPALLIEPPSGYVLLKKGITKQDGRTYIEVYNRQFLIENLYAFKLKDKKVFDITKEIKNDIENITDQ